MSADELVAVDEAASVLGVSKRRVRWWVETGKLTAAQRGPTLFERRELAAFIARRRGYRFLAIIAWTVLTVFIFAGLVFWGKLLKWATSLSPATPPAINADGSLAATSFEPGQLLMWAGLAVLALVLIWIANAIFRTGQALWYESAWVPRKGYRWFWR